MLDPGDLRRRRFSALLLGGTAFVALALNDDGRIGEIVHDAS